MDFYCDERVPLWIQIGYSSSDLSFRQNEEKQHARAILEAKKILTKVLYEPDFTKDHSVLPKEFFRQAGVEVEPSAVCSVSTVAPVCANCKVVAHHCSARGRGAL